MKTLDQIAKEAGITRAAVYKRFQSYGLSVTDLKGEKRGHAILYDDKTERLIKLMFQPEDEGYNTGNTLDAVSDNTVDNKVAELNAKVLELQGIIDKLQLENKAAEQGTEKAEERAASETARADRAEAQNELLLHQIDKLTDAVKAAQTIQAAQIAALQAPQDSKGSWFGRIKNRLRGAKREAED